MIAMLYTEAVVGASVRDTEWGGTCTGTVVDVHDGWVFVQWHGTCVEDQLKPRDVVLAPDVPRPDRDGLRPMILHPPTGRRRARG